MAVNQFVMPGFAAFHLGIEKPVDELAEPVDIAQTEDSGPTEVVVPGEAGPTTAPMPETDIQMEMADHIDGSE